MKRQKYKIGLIVAIPLPGKKFAYAKVFNDGDLGVYNFISTKIEPLERVVKHKILFYDCLTDKSIERGEFSIIGEEPFKDKNSAWAPPMASGIWPDDPEVGVPHIDFRGKSKRVSSLKEVKGMDVRSFNQRTELFVKEVVDRLIRKDHRKYRIK